jgi:hypothetical protein
MASTYHDISLNLAEYTRNFGQSANCMPNTIGIKVYLINKIVFFNKNKYDSQPELLLKISLFLSQS